MKKILIKDDEGKKIDSVNNFVSGSVLDKKFLIILSKKGLS